jgi:hypothetical protein
MYLTITHNNGIVEESTLGLKSSQDLINRLVESGNVKEIKSGTKVLYIDNSIKEFYEKVESLEFYAEAVGDNCFGSGCIYEHGEKSKRAIEKRHIVAHNDFVKMYERAKNLRVEISRNVKSIEDRKELIGRCIYVMRNMKSYISAREVV